MSTTPTSSQASSIVNSTGSFISGFPSSFEAVLVPAVVFASMLLLSLFQICRGKAWFFWSFTAALTLEAAGFGALAYSAKLETDHTLYLLSMGFLTLAPALLALSTFSAHARIISSTLYFPTKRSFRTLWLPEHLIAPVFSIAEMAAILCFTSAMLALAGMHSPSPIRSHQDALARLSYESHALAFLRIGYCIQFAALLLFTMVSNGSSIADYIHGPTKTLYWTVNWVAIFNLIPTSWKVLDFIGAQPESLDLLGSGLSALLIDAVPLIAAFALFIKYHPGKIQHDRITLDLDPSMRYSGFTVYETSEKC